MKIVIAAGGTGGHVNPAIAIARALEPDYVTFIGTERGAEASLVPAAGYPLRRIEVRGFDRAKPLTILGTGWMAARATASARRILKEIKPEVVVGMGGYVSLVVCAAARMTGIPIVLHEQNIVLGLANKLSKRWAAVVAVSFEQTLRDAGARSVHVGNPVAPELSSANLEAERQRALSRFELDPARRTLLVFGGSQGATRINRAAAGLASAWADRNDRQIVHITGRHHYGAVAATIAGAGGRLIYRVIDFADRMVEAYAVADLALCRGGATTVAELAVVGLPAVIVPYPFHRDQQQERHAQVFEAAGAGVLLRDQETTTDRIAAEADRLLSDAAALEKMRESARALGRPDAAERVARIVREVAA